MDDDRIIMQSNADLSDVRDQVVGRTSAQMIVGSIVLGVVVFVSTLAGISVVGAGSDVVQALAGAAFSIVLLTPLMFLMYRWSMRETARSIEVAADWELRVSSEASRREFEARVADAFEMAESEGEALKVVERSLVSVLPDQPVELLLADNSHAHLERLVAVGGAAADAGCPVGSPNECPAARRARVLEFPDSEAVNACPKLAGRVEGGCSAVCMPVSVMGRAVGVIHTIAPREAELSRAVVGDLQAIANQAGARLGMLRVLADSQLQASTDGLTGLLNRRAFEDRFRSFRNRRGPFAIAMADLDNFKHVNDRHGHETGDRALRTFAEGLRASLRQEDVVCRYGGDEFALLFPTCTGDDAGALAERIRTALSETLAASGLPRYTVSFGIVDGDPREDLEELLRHADACLFEAKRLGRDRVVVNDQVLTKPTPPTHLVATDAVTPDAVTPDAVTPDAVTPDAVTPDVVTPEVAAAS